MKTIASQRAYHLADAVTHMAVRYGEAQTMRAFAVALLDRFPTQERLAADKAKWDRACDRRYLALRRLTDALRDLTIPQA